MSNIVNAASNIFLGRLHIFYFLIFTNIILLKKKYRLFEEVPRKHHGGKKGCINNVFNVNLMLGRS